MSSTDTGLTVKESTIEEEADRILNKSTMGFQPKYNNVSCGCLKESNPLRKACIRLVHNAYFELFIITMILANCVFLALSSPHPLCCTGVDPIIGSTYVKTGFMASYGTGSYDGKIVKCGADNYMRQWDDTKSPAVGPRDTIGVADIWVKQTDRCCVEETLDGVLPSKHPITDQLISTTKQCKDVGLTQASEIAEVVFLVAFTFEMIAKIIAMGFIWTAPKPEDGIGGSYLRDAWNWLDFVVVIVAFLAYIPGVGNFSGLRTVRILRPLKTMTAIPGMKTIVSSLLASMTSMVSVIILAGALFTLFGVLGVQLFVGTLEGQCFYLDQGAIDSETGGWIADDLQGDLCGLEVFPETSYGTDCRFEGFVAGYLHHLGQNGGLVNGTYVDMNNYTATNPLALGGYGKFTLADGTWTDTLGGWGFTKDGWIVDDDTTRMVEGCRPSAHTAEFGRTCDPRSYGSDTWSVEAGTMRCLPNGNPNGGWSSFDNVGVAIAWIFASITLEGWVDSMYAVGSTWSSKNVWIYCIVWTYYLMMIVLCNFVLINLFLAVVADEYTAQEISEKEVRDDKIEEVKQSYLTDGYEIDYDLQAAEREKKARGNEEVLPEPWGPGWVRIFYNIATNNKFNSIITFIIVINTVIMGLERYPEDPTIVAFSEITNYIFTAIFFLEMVIKLIGLHPRGYVQDSFNVFDGVVVMISLVELLLAALGSGGGGLAVLRSFRLVRVFKLARSWKDLQKLLTTIANSLVDVMSAAMLMVLVMFIFCLLGMQFFGGQWTPDAFGGGCSIDNSTGTPGIGCEGDDVPRANFDDFGWAFVTVFQVLTGENWNDLLWAGIAAGHYSAGTAVIAVIYFVLLNIIGNYVIMNIFLAILLAGFDAPDDDDEEEDVKPKGDIKGAKVLPQEKYEMKVEESEEAAQEGDVHKKRKMIGQRSVAGEIHDDTTEPIPSDEAEPELVLAGRSLCCLGPKNPLRKKIFALIAHPWFDQFILGCIIISSAFLAMDEPWVSVCACYGYDGTKAIEPLYEIPTCTEERSFAKMFPSGPAGSSLPGNSLGYYQFLVISDVIVTIIFVFEMVFKIIGLGFIGWDKTEIRIGKFYLCIPGFGGKDGKYTYLRNPWNVLDFVIVIVAVISIFTGPLAVGYCSSKKAGGVLKALRSLRAMRALRPLRVIRRYPGLKLVVNSIFKALPQILNVAMVAALIFLIFAIVGVQFFKGTMAACNDGDIENMVECVGFFTIAGGDCGMLPTAAEQDQCLANGDAGSLFPRVWESTPVNFDNVGNALVSIYEITSGEMWPDIMYNTIDGVQPTSKYCNGIKDALTTEQKAFWLSSTTYSQANYEDTYSKCTPSTPLECNWGYSTYPCALGMTENYNRAWPSVYYFLVQVVGAMIMINVFCGVIIDKYNEMKEESEGSALLTNDQKLWVEAMKLAMAGHAVKGWPRPNSGFLCIPKKPRLAFYNFCMLPGFDAFIMGCILLNTVFMGMRHADMGQFLLDFLYYGNLIFGIIFTIEAIIKIIGLGVGYFGDNWNRFDFILVLLSWIGLLFNLGSLASLFRVLRVARMVRLLRKNKGLMDLFSTILASIPAMFNVILLLMLFMFIFACVAMNLFANVKHGENLSGDANFMTFFMAFNTMWRMSTGESFNGVMHDTRITPPICSYKEGGMVDPKIGNCGIDQTPQAFFILMFTVLNYVFLNMIMAIVLDNFGDTQALAHCKFEPEHLEDFTDAWAKLDPRGSGFIRAADLEVVLMDVEYPLGLKNIPMEHLHESSLRKYKNRYIHQLNLPHIDGKIEFKNTRKALVECVMGTQEDLPESAVVVKDFQRRLSKVDSHILKNHKGVTRVDNGAVKKCETGNVRVTDLYGLQHIYASKTIQAMFRQYKARLHVIKLKVVAQRLLAEREAAKKQQV